MNKPDANLCPGVAFITGGSRGLGLAVAISFARSGATGIVLIDINPDEVLQAAKAEVEKYGVKCITIRADVTVEDEVREAVQRAASAFGRIDYAVNFAGIPGPVSRITDSPLEEFRKTVDVNTIGVWLCTKWELRQMENQRLLNICETSAYTTSKHGVVGITKAAALEAREKNIRVNCISPGFVYTPLVAAGLSKAGPEKQAVWESYESRQGRKATPEEVGTATVALSSSMMSLVNGQNLICDNGFAISEN